MDEKMLVTTIADLRSIDPSWLLTKLDGMDALKANRALTDDCGCDGSENKIKPIIGLAASIHSKIVNPFIPPFERYYNILSVLVMMSTAAVLLKELVE